MIFLLLSKGRLATSNAVKICKKRKRKDKKKRDFPEASHTVTVLAFSRADRPLSSHSKELFNERNLCRVSFDMPVRHFLLVWGVCSFFLDHRNPIPFRDSNGGYSPLWVNLIVKWKISSALTHSNLYLHTFLCYLDLFPFSKIDSMKFHSVNISIRVNVATIYKCLIL